MDASQGNGLDLVGFLMAPSFRMTEAAGTAARRIRFIVNPRSGHVMRKPEVIARIRRLIDKHHLDAEITPTARPRHAGELARRAVDDGCSLVVAVGGDGTMNEVAAALRDTPAVLGLLPCGSGNGLGRHLGIRAADDQAFDTLLHGRIRTIDSGTVNELPFFNTMGLGFDVEIARRFNHLSRRGLPAYVATTLLAWREYSPDQYVIQWDSGRTETAAFLVSIANSDQYGNDCFIAPGATVDDGCLDLTVLRRVHLFNAAPLTLQLFLRALQEGADILRARGRSFTIERRTPGLIHTDGEIHQAPAVLDVRVHAHSLRVLVPQPAPVI